MSKVFEDYLKSVKDNFSKSIVPRQVLNETKSEFEETVYDMYRTQLPEEKAVVLMENFYRKYRGFLITAIC